MANFDATFDQQRTFAIRAWIAGNHVTDIGNFWRRDIAIPVDTEIVLTIDVCASGEIAHCRNGTVDNHWNRHIHWTQ